MKTSIFEKNKLKDNVPKWGRCVFISWAGHPPMADSAVGTMVSNSLADPPTIPISRPTTLKPRFSREESEDALAPLVGGPGGVSCIAGHACGNFSVQGAEKRRHPKRLFKNGSLTSTATFVQGDWVYVKDGVQCPCCHFLCCYNNDICLAAMKAHVKTHAQKENTVTKMHHIGLFFESYFGGSALAKNNAILLSHRKQLMTRSKAHQEITTCSTCKTCLGPCVFLGLKNRWQCLHCFKKPPALLLGNPFSHDNCFLKWTQDEMKLVIFAIACAQAQPPWEVKCIAKDVKPRMFNVYAEERTQGICVPQEGPFPVRIENSDIKVSDWKFVDDSQDASFEVKGRENVGISEIKSILTAVAEGKNVQDYIQFPLALFKDQSVFHTIRSFFLDGMPLASHEIVCVAGTTLVLMGGEGCGTGFHVDRSEACNVAWKVSKSKSCKRAKGLCQDEVLAIWTFISPASLQAASQWLQNRGHAFSTCTLICEDLMNELVQHLGQAGGECFVFHQKAGDCVYVPACWPHSVRNKVVNVKVAFDFYNDEHYHLYDEASIIASKYFEESNADDYMRVPAVMRAALR